MTAVGDTADEIAATREHARTMIAFYGSTRTYSPVFEHHGYDGLSDALHERQREGDIKGMAALITDDILDHYYRARRAGTTSPTRSSSATATSRPACGS